MNRILLVSVSLLFLGCGTGNTEKPTGQTPSDVGTVVDHGGSGSSTTVILAPSKDQTHPAKLNGQVDSILGQDIPRSQSWAVEDGVFYKNGSEVILRGINWFGFEGGDLSLHGLWTGRTVESFVSQMKTLGFNSFRIPVSPQVLEGGYKSNFGKPSPEDNLRDIVTVADKYDMNILLDLHTCNYRAGIVGDPSRCGGDAKNYNIETWYSALVKLATFSKSYPNVLGIDIYNEPHAVSWKTWQKLSTEAGKRILSVNPKLLIFVEGVNSLDTDNKGYWTFWGENLVEAGNNMPGLPASRLVLSPHVYGPSVGNQSYFNVPEFPSNMSHIWDLHFGYLAGRKGITMSISEFGGRYVGKDKVWADALIPYMKNKKLTSFFYWSLNPNSGDTGGILNDDWTTVNEDKMKLLRKLF